MCGKQQLRRRWGAPLDGNSPLNGTPRKGVYTVALHCLPTVQPLRVVQPDAVCEVGGWTPDLSYGDLGIFLGGGQIENLYTS